MKITKVHKAKRVVKHFSPRQVARRASTAKTIRSLADSLGFVYFGYVDQQDDEHRLVRGMTTSSTQKDRYYTLGTFKTYDTAIVVRNTIRSLVGKKPKEMTWTIVTVDLHTSVNVPHIFIADKNVKNLLDLTYSRLDELPIQPNNNELAAFLRSHRLYARLVKEHQVYDLLPAQFLAAYPQHSGRLSTEIVDNTVYIYANEKHPSRVLIERMINFGVWVAQTVDQVASTPRAKED